MLATATQCVKYDDKGGEDVLGVFRKVSKSDWRAWVRLSPFRLS